MNKRYKFYEDKAKAKGKQLFIEEYSINFTPSQVVVYDKIQLVEDANGNNFQCRGILKKVPVTKYDEFNANRRKYPKSIGLAIQEKKLAEGNDCFGNHAENEPSVFDTVGVWHNFIVEDSIGYADLYCIGDGGQLMLEKAKAGGKCGFSSVMYGELMEGDVVNPETVELDHIGDWVNNPSAGVFGTYENIAESIQIKYEQTQTKIIEEKITNNKNVSNNNIDIIENKEENIMTDRIQEANLKNQVRTALKEAKAKENLAEAIEDLKELKSIVPVELSDSHSKIDAMMEAIQAKQDEKIESAKKLIEQKEVSLKEMTEKYEVATKALDELKEKYTKLESIVENTSEKDVKVLVENCDKMKNDINMYEEKTALMLSDIESFLEDRKGLTSDLKLAMKERKEMDFDIKKLEEAKTTMSKDISTYKKQLKHAESHIKKLEKVCEEFGYEFDDDVVDEGFDDDYAIDDFMSDTYDNEEDVDVITDAEVSDGYDSNLLPDMDFMEAEEDDEDEEEGEEMTEAEDEDSEEDEDEKKEESIKRAKIAKQKAMKESVERKKIEERKRVLDQIKDYYIDAVKERPGLKDIKESLFKSASLYEAVKKVKRFEETKKNDTMELKSTSRLANPKDQYEYKFNRD